MFNYLCFTTIKVRIWFAHCQWHMVYEFNLIPDIYGLDCTGW